MGDMLVAHWGAVRDRIAQILHGAPRAPLASSHLKSPVAKPSKIIGVTRNRRGLAFSDLSSRLFR